MNIGLVLVIIILLVIFVSDSEFYSESKENVMAVIVGFGTFILTIIGIVALIFLIFDFLIPFLSSLIVS